MTHQYPEARNLSPKKRGTLGTLNSRNPTTCFPGHQGSAEPMLKITELDYVSTHTRKSILTSTNPTTHLLYLHRNVS